LAISKGCGKRVREDSFIVLPSTLSIRPAFPPLCFSKLLKVDHDSICNTEGVAGLGPNDFIPDILVRLVVLVDEDSSFR